jgi:hypothetical protein
VVPFAVNLEVVAVPKLLMVVNVLLPPKLALGPLLGALKVTGTPLRPFPPASVTVALI